MTNLCGTENALRVLLGGFAFFGGGALIISAQTSGTEELEAEVKQLREQLAETEAELSQVRTERDAIEDHAEEVEERADDAEARAAELQSLLWEQEAQVDWELRGARVAERRAAERAERMEQQLRTQRSVAEAEVREARAAEEAAAERAAAAERRMEQAADLEPAALLIGPFHIGGAIRANYVLGDYPHGEGPSRGAEGGDFSLDTFRINVGYVHEHWLGALEYRWYTGYNFLHTAWLGYDFEEAGEVRVGLNRVPFGPGTYGVSNSWFFDQHYYVGLADDMDIGVKYSRSVGETLYLDLGYYWRDEGSWRGASRDAARYSYDPVVNEEGNGYEERHTWVARLVGRLSNAPVPTEVGVSAQYGQLNANGAFERDGEHYALSVHMVNQLRGFTLKTQLTGYQFDIATYTEDFDPSRPWQADDLILMGAFDFAWPVAAKGVIPAVTLSYTHTVEQVNWLDSVTPYLEVSSILKQEEAFNDSALFIIGAAWARGGWYIYTDWAFSNGNFFVGDDGDEYNPDYTGTGDFGINGNNTWNTRFNINFGYYF